MATITALTENFENGSNGANITSALTIFNNITGTGSSTFSNLSPLEASLCMRSNVSAQTSINRVDITATSTVWVGCYLYISSTPAINTIIFGWYNNTTTIGTVQLTPANELRIRDTSTTRWTSSALTAGVWHRVAIRAQPSTSTGHQLKIYSGANLHGATASQDSGGVTATGAAVSTVDNIRVGAMTSDTMDIRFDQIRGDNAVEPVYATNQSPIANAGADQSVTTGTQVTLDGSGSSDPDGTIASYSWTQTAGTSVTLSGSGTTRTFTPSGSGTYSFQLTVTDNGGATASDAIDVVVSSGGGGATLSDYIRAVAGVGSSSNVSTLSIQMPAAAQVGDIAIVSGNVGAGAGVTMTGPSGYTQLVYQASTYNTAQLGLYRKTLVAGDLGSIITITCSAGRTLNLSVIVLKNVNYDTISGSVTEENNVSVATLPSVTPTSADSVLVSFVNASADAIVDVSSSIGWTEQSEVFETGGSTPNFNYISARLRNGTVNTATTAGTATLASGTMQYLSTTLAFNALAVTPPPVSNPTLTVWDGTQRVPATVKGVWDGTQVVAGSIKSITL